MGVRVVGYISSNEYCRFSKSDAAKEALKIQIDEFLASITVCKVLVAHFYHE